MAAILLPFRKTQLGIVGRVARRGFDPRSDSPPSPAGIQLPGQLPPGWHSALASATILDSYAAFRRTWWVTISASACNQSS